MTVRNDVLQPLRMGELFDRAIRLYRRNFFKFIGVLAVMQIPVTGLTLIINLATYRSSLVTMPDPAEIAAQPDPFSLFGSDYYIGVFANLLVSFLYIVLISGVASAALTNLVANSYLGAEQQTDSPFDAYREIGDRWGTLVRAIVLYGLIAILLVAWLIIPCIGWSTGPGMLIVLTAMVFPLVAPVVMLENASARASLRRAWDLVRRRFWWVFGFIILLFLFSWVVAGGPSLLIGMGFAVLVPDSIASGNPQAFYNIQTVVQAMTGMVFNLLYTPLQLTCLTLLYFDLRVRFEGLDLIAESIPEQKDVPALRRLVAASVPTGDESLFSGRDFVNFFGVSILIVAVYLVLVFVLAAVFLSVGAF